MKVLVINCGSSSLKYSLQDGASGRVLAGGLLAGLFTPEARQKHRTGSALLERRVEAPDYAAGFRLVMDTLLDPEHGVIGSPEEITAVGHRAVHGGDRFTGSVLIGAEVLDKLTACIPLAPIHNPANLAGMREAMALLPDVPHVAVFDTAFHQTLPPRAHVYPLPYELYEKHAIRRYGFHGTSCRYVSARAAELLGRPLEELRMILCHLGNGCTVAALEGGRSVDTSLGFTPLEGMMMGARPGDLDPGVILHLQRELGYGWKDLEAMLNGGSGLLGVSGISNDMAILLNRSSLEPRAALAVEMFCYRLRKYIGAYAAALGGVDALVFTGGIGENAAPVREEACRGLGFMGLDLDPERNRTQNGREGRIDRGGGAAVLVVPTDEEAMIARDTLTVSGLMP